MSPYKKPVYDPSTTQIAQTQSIFIASRLFYDKHNRHPTVSDFDQVLELVNQFSPPTEDLDKMIREYIRFNGTILPSVAASISSIAAQEITKTIIRQANPFPGTFVYDGIHGLIGTDN